MCAGGKELATYYGSQLYFALTDWLGTKRREAEVQVSGSTATATVAEYCTSLPYGDNLSCTGTDPDQLHYTGKEHDTESDNDYFEARYYASGIAGRFLTPDPSGLYYADPNNPQSLNLYSYAQNNPLKFIDPTGMGFCFFGGEGDTPENDADPTDYDFKPDSTKECQQNGGVYVPGGDVNIKVTPQGSICTGSGCTDPFFDLVNGPYYGRQQQAAAVPSNIPGTTGPNYSRAQVCAASALLKGGGQTALDAVGIIPGDNTALKAFQIGTGILSAGIAAYNNSPPADGFLAAAGTGLAAAESYSTNISFRGVEIMPIVGNGFAGIATARDLKNMGKDFDGCMGGS